ncbi:MAG: amino acid ABC transporter permease [Acidimicrobiales bacterium]
MSVEAQLEAAAKDLLAATKAADAVRPDEPSLSLRPWMRKNLFSSISSVILTVVFAAISIFAYRGVLNFIFSEERRWDAIRVNLRALFTFAYPESQYIRIWVTLGIVLMLTGLSMGLMKSIGQGFSIKRISMWFLSSGSAIIGGLILREPSVLKHPDGTPVLDENLQVIRESFSAAMGDRVWWWLGGLVALGIGLGLWFGFGELRRRTTFIAAIPLTLGFIGMCISTVWWFKWGHYGTNTAGDIIIEPGRTVAATTKGPWTVMWFVLVFAYIAGRAVFTTKRAATARASLGLAWLLAPFMTFFVILRDPALDWSHVWSTHIPMALAFIIGGGLVLWALTNPNIGEIGRLIAIVLITLALFHWVAGFFGWYPMLQKARISFLLLGLAGASAHNFAGDARQRSRMVWGWVGLMVIVHYLATMINTASTLEVNGEFAGGFVVTLYIAAFTMTFSLPLGVMLALGRTSTMPLFRILSTTYIELVRGIPFITILFFFAVFVNFFLPEGMELAKLAAAGIGFSLFGAAYLAENVRGGLQAIQRGQYEASDALGLTTVQRTSFIVLPQALQVSIPPLVGGAIGTFKETSLLSIVGIIDFTRVANSSIPGQTEFVGVKREGLLFISLIYWIGAYSMSKYSQRLEKQLGVGER